MTVIKRSVSPTVQASSVGGDDQLRLGVKTNDLDIGVALARRGLGGFNGLEKPFALVPSERDGRVTWWRHELRFRGARQEGLAHHDAFESDVISRVDRRAVEKYGIAFGLETNRGTVWNQEPGENERVLWK